MAKAAHGKAATLAIRLSQALTYLLGSIAAGVIVLQLWFLISIASWAALDPGSTTFMRNERWRLCGVNVWSCGISHDWVDYCKISKAAKRAIIAAEDSGFVNHDGFEADAIRQAWEKNQRRGKTVSGGSTITQQLAKNLFLTGERSYVRKGQEFMIAAMLELLLSKERILEIYLNSVEWGEGIFGIEAAARHYYRIPAARLGVEQAARLAAALPAPKCFDQRKYCKKIRIDFESRAGTILARMNAVEIPD
ncbi:MAG: monofunctional biosynthetic peptidoglycan transglycosylase [Candidatus Protistobacter heckmanni]|nr:monofunctional biosynthetic peptidoglycan transglycosylase [Candidatus Protistobacter heckmanni]